MASYGSIHQHQMMVSDIKEVQSIQMTDYFFLFSLFLLLFWALDPLQIGFETVPGIKRFPTFMMALNLCFIAIGRKLFIRKNKYVTFLDVVLELRYLVAFSSLVILGSLYAKFKNGIDETFLTMGIYVLVAPLMYWYVVNSAAPFKLLRAILIVLTFWAVVVGGLQLGFFRKYELFHNKEHLIMPVLATLVYFAPWRIGPWLAPILVATVAIATNKNTAFALAVFVSGYLVSLAFFRWVRRFKDPLARVTFLLGFITFIAVSAGAVVLAYKYFVTDLPTGNPEYRLHTYGIAWDKFQSSPGWGNFYTKAAVEFFDQFDVVAGTQNLPTHSDPLDILANGGLLGIGLWLTGTLPAMWMAFRLLTSGARKVDWQSEWVHQSYLLMSISAMFVCSFNPIYNVPNLAAANWMVFGCMVVSTRLCRAKLAEKVGK